MSPICARKLLNRVTKYLVILVKIAMTAAKVSINAVIFVYFDCSDKHPTLAPSQAAAKEADVA
jgi:hypothetical protein